MLPRALARSRLIARFPFVRGVCLSGTISKGVMGPGDDVDFFVITAPSRVWLCRALLMTFKRVALLGSHRLFCVNYLMSEDQLAVPDRNLFTATEIAWLRPTVGQLPYRRFVAANAWVSEFFPNWSPAARSVAEVVTGPLARACERALRGARGDALDARCRAAIERRNRKRHGHLPPEIYEVALRATKAASKHHPSHYQDRVIGRLEAAIADFERCHGVSLSLAEPMTRASRPGLELAVAGGRA
jgi:hypothetical protein